MHYCIHFLVTHQIWSQWLPPVLTSKFILAIEIVRRPANQKDRGHIKPILAIEILRRPMPHSVGVANPRATSIANLSN
jgi:hypothetical protein